MKKSTVNVSMVRKKLLSLLLVMCMLLTMLPTTAMAAEAPSGYTTDSNGLMAYKYVNIAQWGRHMNFPCLSIKGYYDGKWYQTTRSYGFVTLLEVDGGENFRYRWDPNRYPASNRVATHVDATGSPFAVGSTGLTVDIDANFLYDGKVIQMLYTVKNTNSSSANFALGSFSIDPFQMEYCKYDPLNVTPFDGGLIFSPGAASEEGARVNFWYGSDIEGVTPVDTCWYGNINYVQENLFTDLPNKTSLNSTAACAWSWKGRTIGAGETQTYSVLFSVGGLGSEKMLSQNTVSYSTTLGTKPDDVAVEPEDTVTLPTLTAAGYEFGGWYSDYELTSYVGAGGESYTPTDNITLYAKWTPIQSPLNVTFTKDSAAWSGQSLALYQGGYYKCALTENGTSGIYSASVINGTYDIYKDGVDTGEDAVVASTATSGSGTAVSVTIGYTTLTATTQLDGSISTTPGTTDLRKNGAVQLTPTGTGGTYTAIVRDNNSSSYDVYVNALDSDQDISVSDNSSTINYFTGEVRVTLDSAAYEDRSVVLSRREGENTYYYTANYSDGKYTVMLPAGPSNNYTYTVSVDGRMLSDTVSYDDKVSAAAYYTAHVEVQKDGSDWTSDVGVYLENDGSQQKLTYTNGTDYQCILFSDGTSYNVLVTGSNSPQDTGIDVSNSDTLKTISYWTTSFYTTDDANAYTTRVIQDGKTVSKPTVPNVTGKSFDDWYKTIGRTDTYDYATAIMETTDIYAKYVDPSVSINGTVMGSNTYTIPNLTITGFPSTGNPVKTAILTVNSGTIDVSSNSGYTVTGNGSTAVTVTFGDEGTSMDAAQEFLRMNTVATPVSIGTAQTLNVTICGDTSSDSVTTSSITVSPVTLNLNGGTVNSGNLSYYEEGVGATLPTDLSKTGNAFAGWYDNAEFNGNAVTEISAGDSGEQTYYAKWTDSTTSGMLDFGTPVLSGSSFTYPNLELTAPSGLTGNLYSVSVSIENGTVAVTGGDGYTVGYDINKTTATINLGTNGLSVSNVQNILRTNVSFSDISSIDYPIVTMTLDGNTTSLPSDDSIFSAGNGTVGLNGHYYMYVPVSGGIDWNSAYNLAKSYTYMGMQGYLVTVTSAAEDLALDQLTTKGGWAGGTRLIGDNNSYDRNPWLLTSTPPYYDNIWKWVCGPEAGTAFYYGSTGESNASAVDGDGSLVANNSMDAVYTHWNPGEPNACDHGVNGGVENTLQIHAGSEGGPYLWNDIPPSWNFDGYFVEFGGYDKAVDPGPGDDEVSENKTITGNNTVKSYVPAISGDTIYANGSALIVSGSNAYWDEDSDGVLDDNEDDSAIYSSVSSSTTIYAGTTNAFVEPLSGQITVLTGSTVGKIDGGNVNGPACVNLSGDVDVTIDLDNITMVSVINTLTCGTGAIKLAATSDVDAERVLAMDKTGADVIDMTKFTLNSGDNTVIAVGDALQISGYGVNAGDSATTTLIGVAPTYITTTVEVKENGSLADAESVVLKPESGTSITLNRSATGAYSYTALMDEATYYTLYIGGVAVGDAYTAFANNTTNTVPSYYTAQVTYKVNGAETDAQSVVLKADGKDDITLTQQIDSDTGSLVTGIYEYRALADSATAYSIWLNGKDSGETLKFANNDYQKTINCYTTEVSLNNSGAWSGKTVTLRDGSGNIIYTLSETDTSGTYSVLTDSNYVETYNIYVDGEDSGTDITPSAAAKAASGSMEYMTVTVTTNKDGTAARLGAVTVGGKATMETSTGNYTISLPAGSYSVSVSGKDVGDVKSGSEALTANFYSVTYDKNGATGTAPVDDTIYFDGSSVTLLSAGELINSGNVFAGWKTDGITYNVGETLVITGTTTLVAQWSTTANAQVSWTIDGMTYYGTLPAAVAAAENTGLPVSITIQNDVTITENLTIPNNVVLTVPEGNTVTVAENVTLTNDGSINSNGTITGDGSLDNNGTVDNTASAATSGVLDIATNNEGGNIEGGTISNGVTVSGGEITGPIINNGTVEEADVTGDVTNSGTLRDTDVSGNVENNNGAEVSGGTITGDVTNDSGAVISGGTIVNGNVDNEGTVEEITVNGNLDSSKGTVTDISVAGTTTAPGGTITTAEKLVAALGGAAHIDAETGVVVLDGDIQLDESITIAGGDILIDLNGYSITGPNGDDNYSGKAEDGGAAIIVTGGTVAVEDNSADGGGSINGGSGGVGSSVSGDGGTGILVSGGTVTVGENVNIVGGSGGFSESGSSGDGGTGIAVSEDADVTIKGIVNGGSGGSSFDDGVGGSGGSGITVSQDADVTVESYVTGGSGGSGDTGGSGGTGIENEGTGMVEVNGTVSGGDGGMDSEGTNAESGTALSGTITYSILESGLTYVELANGSTTKVETEKGLVADDTDIALESSFSTLYDMATSVTVGIYNSSTGTTTALDSSYYTYNSTTGVVTILEDTPITGSIVITAAGVKKTGTVTITTEDELIEALENGFTDIVVNGSISIDEEVAIPNGTTVSIASGKTITVADGGSIANNGTITGEGDVTVANGGSIYNKGTISNNEITVSSGGSVTNRNGGSITTTQTIANSGTITNDGSIASAITNNGTVYQVDGAPEITVKGTGAVTVFKVSYHVKGVGATPDSALNVTALPNPLPTPAGESNYTFNGWFADSSCATAAVAGTSITGNTVLYAGWTYTGGYSSGSSSHTTTEVSEGTVTVIVDGTSHNIGTAETSDGVTTVTIDQEELTNQIESAETGGEVIVPITTAENAESGAAVLVLQNIKDMDTNNISLTVEVDDVALTLPAGSIDTVSVAKALGAENYEEVPVSVRLTMLSGNALETVLEAVESTGAKPVGSAFNFIVTAQYGGKSVDVTAFRHFTSRTLPIEEGSAITTAVVVESDGTLRHVPTNGTTDLAIVSSLTNSTYVLIYNEQRFTDASDKWYEDTVNEMASRKIINGVGDNLFAGERSITRAEFAAIVVRSLGLPADGKADFSDVSGSAWYAGAVGTAYEYGIINGKSTDLFDPMANITRQEAMAMVARAAKIAELEGETIADLSAFMDSDSVDVWAQSYVEYNVANGLIVGDDNGNLNSMGNISRAETATVILRLLRNAKLIDKRG